MDNMGPEYSNVMLDAANLIFRRNLSPMMALAYAIHVRGYESNDTSKIMSDILGRNVTRACARDFTRRAIQKMDGLMGRYD